MIRVENVTVQAGDYALKNVNLHVPEGTSRIVLGPSGTGKTLLLEAMLGLRAVAAGRIFIGGREVTNLPPEARGIAYMPQDGALFPHLSVRENICFGRRVHGTLAGVATELPELCQALHISDAMLARHSIRSLSGGERQRVALARSLLVKPNVLFLDESFSALDANVRQQLLLQLRQIQQARRQTLVYVTHNQYDAELLGDDVTVVLGGAIAQTAPVRDLCVTPGSAAIAQFLQLPNMVALQRASVDEPFRCDALSWTLPTDALAVTVTIRREACHVLAAGQAEALGLTNTVAATVTSVFTAQRRDYARVTLSDGTVLECDVALWQLHADGLPEVGAMVLVHVPSNAVSLIGATRYTQGANE
ncbi:MAG TPA: ABC transporter ATP-binding protein [Kofleriaceae bacterium]|nr:ABC transporter ATP-binding protein [Kofleriaceae bacterium]